ncbi:MAG: hypothetical protein ACTSU5_10185, partial [Promethearchaeota archaeon]
MGQKVYIYVESFTPSGKLNQYVPNATLLKKGFDVDRMYTYIQVNTSQPYYYFDEALSLNLTMFDELNNTLLEEKLNLTITVPGFPVYQFDVVVGVNNTQPFTLPDFLPYVGNLTIRAEYSGNARYYPSSFTTNITYRKAPSIVDVDVDPSGYNYGGGETISIDIQVLDFRNNTRFYGTGDIVAKVYNESDAQVEFWNPVLNPSNPSNVTLNWHVDQNGLYYINVSYGGGLYHLSSELNLSVVVDRAPVIVKITPSSFIAGQDLLFEALVTYDNGTPIAGMACVFQFTDLFRNTYLLGFNSSDDDGFVRLWYPFDEDDYYYLYLVEFGGEISVTSKMDLQFASGFDAIEDFQIQKCPTAIRISSEPSLGGEILVSLVLDTSDYASPIGETLEVEIWSSEGTDYKKFNIDVQGNTTSFTHAVLDQGVYFVRVVYKGSKIFQPTANILRFLPSNASTSSELPSPGGGQVAGTVNGGGTPAEHLLLFLFALAPLLVLVSAKASFKTPRGIKFLGLALVALFAVSSAYYTAVTASAVPEPPHETISDFNLACQSGFGWLDSEDLSEEERASFESSLNLEGENGGILNDLASEFGIGDPGSLNLRGAQGFDGNIKDTNLGEFGMVPYPVGDTLNISFSTREESNYFIVVTDINRRSRVLSIYGSCGEDESQEILVPITTDKFSVGGKYALELFVYNRWSLSYRSRDMRRMTFSVIRGFVDIDLDLHDVELFQQRYYSITILEKFSGQPLANQDVTVLTYDEDSKDYVFDRHITTDALGKIVIPLPRNEPKGNVPIKIVFKGDEEHYGTEQSTLYEVKPITTTLSLAAPPVYYTDSGNISALLYDQYGNPLEGKDVSFFVHLENTTYGDKALVEVEDEWLPLGNQTTGTDGVATLQYTASFPEGLYEVAANFEGDDYYNQTRTQGYILEVYKERLNIEFVDTELTFGQRGYISANLTDDDGPGGTTGNASTYTPVSFSTYYHHQWVFLGSTNTTGSGLAAVEYTPYFDEGTYPLRLTKEEDNRYACNVEYGELTIHKSNSHLDVGLNSTQYMDEITLSAKLTFDNGTSIDPVAGESLLFYMEQDMNEGPNQFTYIGYALTDANGTARLVWNATGRKPGIYQLKVLFPGNSFADRVETIEPGVQISKGSLTMEITAPSQTPIMDYCDIVFNLTNRFHEPIFGEKIHVNIHNKTDPSEVVIERDILTDDEGIAYFRWLPGNPGNYTAEARVVSEYYDAYATTLITVIRKSVVFNTTVNGVKFHRGDLFSVTGNTTIVYKNYDGSKTYLPATGVPLRFNIWNESHFTHPVSGFQVPNVPLRNLDGEINTYSDDSGLFRWDFIVPDEFYGLQAGQYYLKIRVDPTEGGLFSGECYISFDLVETTSMEVWVDPSQDVLLAQQKGHYWSRDYLDEDHDYFVEEQEKVNIKLLDQDGEGGTQVHVDGHRGLTRTINGIPTYRDLLINIGEEAVLYFHLDEFDNPSLYVYNDTGYPKGSLEDLALMTNYLLVDFQADPQYDPATGIYSFKYRPYFPGSCDVAVTFVGDRFYDTANSTFHREVYRRPTYFDTVVSHTRDLYRNGTDPENELGLQKWTHFSIKVTDVINGTPTSSRWVWCYFDTKLMNDINGFSYDNFNLELGDKLNRTDVTGQIQFKWYVEDWLQHGDYTLLIKANQTRIYQERLSEYTIEIWETSRVEIIDVDYNPFGLFLGNNYRYTVGFYDQDGHPIRDARYYFVAIGHTSFEQFSHGSGRITETGLASSGVAQISWNPVYSWRNGMFNVICDFLGDPDHNIRASSNIYQGLAIILWDWSFPNPTVPDLLLWNAPQGSSARANNPYLAFSARDESNDYVYYNIQEARRAYDYVDDAPIQVNTFDGYGYVDFNTAYYVWQTNSPTLGYYPSGFRSDLPTIIAFGSRENARLHVEEYSNYDARIVPWDFVWFHPWGGASNPVGGNSPSSAGGSGVITLPNVYVTEEDHKRMSVEPYLPKSAKETGIPNSNPNSATYLESQGVGTSRTHRSESGSLYGSIANMAMDYSLRGSYVFTFRLLEYIFSGGRVYIPGDPEPVFKRESDDLVFYDQNFEDTGLGVTTLESNPGVLYTNINSSVKHEGSRALYVFSNGTPTTGDQVIIPYTPYHYLSQASSVSFWLRYSSPVPDQSNVGITVKFVDSDGRWRETDVRGEDIETYDQWHKVTISLKDLLVTDEVGGQMQFGKLEKILFEIKSGGILSTPGAELWIDQIRFTRTKASMDIIYNSGYWQRMDYDDFLNKQIVTYLIARQLFLACIYAARHVPCLYHLRSVFSWNNFKATAENSIGAGAGSRDPYGALRDLLAVVYTVFLDIEGKSSSSYPRFLSSSNLLGVLSAYYSLSPYQRELLRQRNDQASLQKVWRFIVCAAVQGICYNVQSYWFDIDDTWNKVVNQGRTNINAIIKVGF